MDERQNDRTVPDPPFLNPPYLRHAGLLGLKSINATHVFDPDPLDVCARTILQPKATLTFHHDPEEQRCSQSCPAARCVSPVGHSWSPEATQLAVTTRKSHHVPPDQVA